jgi:DNA gyrase/topoisomerase IV subunit A
MDSFKQFYDTENDIYSVPRECMITLAEGIDELKAEVEELNEKIVVWETDETDDAIMHLLGCDNCDIIEAVEKLKEENRCLKAGYKRIKEDNDKLCSRWVKGSYEIVEAGTLNELKEENQYLKVALDIVKAENEVNKKNMFLSMAENKKHKEAETKLDKELIDLIWDPLLENGFIMKHPLAPIQDHLKILVDDYEKVQKNCGVIADFQDIEHERYLSAIEKGSDQLCEVATELGIDHHGGNGDIIASIKKLTEIDHQLYSVRRDKELSEHGIEDISDLENIKEEIEELKEKITCLESGLGSGDAEYDDLKEEIEELKMKYVRGWDQGEYHE